MYSMTNVQALKSFLNTNLVLVSLMIFEKEKEIHVHWIRQVSTATFEKGQKINPSRYRIVGQPCFNFWKNYTLCSFGAHFLVCEVKQVTGSHQHDFTKSKL